jgi:hypothetical protein
MRRITALLLVGANILGVAAFWSTPGVAAADSSSAGSFQPLIPKFRACDFTWAPNVPTFGTGRGQSVISKAAPNKVVAQVELAAAEPHVGHHRADLVEIGLKTTIPRA